MARHSVKCSAKPLLVAGHGIRLAGAQAELEQVLDQYKIPVVTTFNGFDLIPNDHPCFVGRIGAMGTYGGNYALNNCDLVICVGTRNNMRQIAFDWDNFAPQAKKVIVDIDKAELDKHHCDLPLWMDAEEFLDTISSYISFSNLDEWLNELKEYDRNHPVELSPPYQFIRDLTEKLRNDAVVVCGNATACLAMFQAGIVKKGQRIFWNSGCASMGYALPASIGAHYASGKEIICITGDGSIMMNLQELQTVKHNNIPIKIIIISNRGYRSIEMTQDKYFEGDLIGCTPESGVSFPDFELVAYSYGIPYIRSMEDFIEHSGSCIYEAKFPDKYEFNPKFTKPLEVKYE